MTKKNTDRGHIDNNHNNGYDHDDWDDYNVDDKHGDCDELDYSDEYNHQITRTA